MQPARRKPEGVRAAGQIKARVHHVAGAGNARKRVRALCGGLAVNQVTPKVLMLADAAMGCLSIKDVQPTVANIGTEAAINFKASRRFIF